MQTLFSLSSSSEIPAPPSGGNVPLGSQDLGFKMQHQLMDNWCWAAVSSSIAQHYSNNISQCEIASRQLNADCCGDPENEDFDQTGYLHIALMDIGHSNLAESPFGYETGHASEGFWKNEILLGRPLGVRVAWFGGNAHFVVVSGFENRNGVTWMHIDDPWTGRSEIPVSSFPQEYNEGGDWTHSYRTVK